MKRLIARGLGFCCIAALTAVALGEVRVFPPLQSQSGNKCPSTCQSSKTVKVSQSTTCQSSKSSCQGAAAITASLDETSKTCSSQGCPVGAAMDSLLAALDDMPADHQGRVHVVAAVRSLANVDSRLEAKLAAYRQASGSTCGSASSDSVLTVVNTSKTSTCRSSKSSCGTKGAAVAAATPVSNRTCSSSKSTCGTKGAAVAAATPVSNQTCSASKSTCGTKGAAVAAATPVSNQTCSSSKSSCGTKGAAVAAAMPVSNQTCNSSKATCGTKGAAVAAATQVSNKKSSSGCCAGSAKPAAAVAAKSSSCSSSSDGSKPAAAIAASNTGKASCSSTCGSTDGKASEARFVAFGCCKTDRVARAAAQAYLQVLRELKLMTGAEGCPAEAASEVLAAVLDDVRSGDAVAQTVSLGAVSGKDCSAECAEACAKACSEACAATCSGQKK